MYDAHHEIVPVREPDLSDPRESYDIVGPVCESADRFAADRLGAAMGRALGERAEQPQITEGSFHTFYTR